VKGKVEGRRERHPGFAFGYAGQGRHEAEVKGSRLTALELGTRSEATRQNDQ